MKAKIDLEKFICSYVKWYNIQDALKDQGLICWNGEIVEISQDSEDEKIRKNCIHFLELQKTHHASTIEIDECIAWLEKQAQSTTITIPKDLKGTDTDGGVVGERGEQGEQPTEEEMVGMGGLGKVWSEQAIISKLDKIIELLQSAILPISRSPYVPPIIYKNPLAPDPTALGGWGTNALLYGADYDIDTDKIKQDETSKSKS